MRLLAVIFIFLLWKAESVKFQAEHKTEPQTPPATETPDPTKPPDDVFTQTINKLSDLFNDTIAPRSRNITEIIKLIVERDKNLRKKLTNIEVEEEKPETEEIILKKKPDEQFGKEVFSNSEAEIEHFLASLSEEKGKISRLNLNLMMINTSINGNNGKSRKEEEKEDNFMPEFFGNKSNLVLNLTRNMIKIERECEKGLKYLQIVYLLYDKHAVPKNSKKNEQEQEEENEQEDWRKKIKLVQDGIAEINKIEFYAVVAETLKTDSLLITKSTFGESFGEKNDKAMKIGAEIARQALGELRKKLKATLRAASSKYKPPKKHNNIKDDFSKIKDIIWRFAEPKGTNNVINETTIERPFDEPEINDNTVTQMYPDNENKPIEEEMYCEEEDDEDEDEDEDLKKYSDKIRCR